MAYIALPTAPELGREFPGIVGLMTFRPETAAPINELVNILLRGESTLTRGERELIAAYVSTRNDCFFCQTIHGAVAAAQLDHNEKLVQAVKTDWVNAGVSAKLKALLNIAGKVQQGGKYVTEEDVTAARGDPRWLALVRVPLPPPLAPRPGAVGPSRPRVAPARPR